MAGQVVEQFPPPFPPLPPSANASFPPLPPNVPLACLASVGPDSPGALPAPPMPKPFATQEYPTLRLVVPTRFVTAATRFQGVEKGELNETFGGILGPQESDATQLIVRGMTRADLEDTIYAMLRSFETFDVSGYINDDVIHLAVKVPHTVAELLLNNCSAKLVDLCRNSISPLKIMVDHRLSKDGIFSEQFVLLSGFPEVLHSVLPELSNIVQEETPKCERLARLSPAATIPTPIVPASATTKSLQNKRNGENRGTPVPEAAGGSAAAVPAAPWHAPATPWTAETQAKDDKDKSQSKSLVRQASEVTSKERATSPPRKKTSLESTVHSTTNANSTQPIVSGQYPPTNYAQVNGGQWTSVASPNGASLYGMSPAYSQWPPTNVPHDGRQAWAPTQQHNGQLASVASNGFGSNGEQSLKEWLRSLDGGYGELLIYHDALLENFETLDDLNEVEKGHDGSVPDSQFFEDLKVTRSDHRELFSRWFLWRLQSRK